MGTDGQTIKQSNGWTNRQIFTQFSGISSHSLRGVQIWAFSSVKETVDIFVVQQHVGPKLVLFYWETVTLNIDLLLQN
jgi:hypothetical protein